MNIHLVSDEKFINRSFETFEHYYPGENIFFVRVSRGFNGELNFVKSGDRIIPICFSDSDAVKQILDYCNKETANLFVHYLEPLKAHVALELKKHIGLTIYWIVYGADLYTLLNKHDKYELYDYSIPVSNKIQKYSPLNFLKSIYLKFKFGVLDIEHVSEELINKAHYFCFWNHYDYKLLKEHYSTDIKFKYFRYFDTPVSEAMSVPLEKKAGHILVNHSASQFGNHLTILKALHEIDKQKRLKKVFTPLGYGSEKVKDMTIKYGEKYLDYCFKPIVKFLPKEEYFNSLNNVSSAIFGHRRQEGGGNIHYLLAVGTKIFLRRDNNLLRYYRDKGYVIFEFEKDLNSITDLEQLDSDSQKNNREIIRKEFSKEEIDRCYESLIED